LMRETRARKNQDNFSKYGFCLIFGQGHGQGIIM
jgi:hypothetical protein